MAVKKWHRAAAYMSKQDIPRRSILNQQCYPSIELVHCLLGSFSRAHNGDFASHHTFNNAQYFARTNDDATMINQRHVMDFIIFAGVDEPETRDDYAVLVINIRLH